MQGIDLARDKQKEANQDSGFFHHVGMMETPLASEIGEEPVELKSVRVRPITKSEQARWEQLMREHHYLGWNGPVGESQACVVTRHDQWVALLARRADLETAHKQRSIDYFDCSPDVPLRSVNSHRKPLIGTICSRPRWWIANGT